ncbi:MAG: hypothetical protein IKQ31_02975 [Clostridia bacterium]|nr:hypothetical protein [Clostridia bacterium]
MEGKKFGTLITKCAFCLFAVLIMSVGLVGCSSVRVQNDNSYTVNNEENIQQEQNEVQEIKVEPNLLVPIKDNVVPTAENTDLILYSGKGFYILLPRGMSTTIVKGADAAYINDKVLFIELRENKKFLSILGVEDISLVDYIKLCLQNNNKSTDNIKTYADENVAFAYASYYYEVQGESHYYMVVVYESENYFYCTDFVCKATDKSIYESKFLSWAKTAVVE